MVDSENGSARLNSTKTFLMSIFKWDKTLLCMANCSACVEDCVCWPATLLIVDQNEKYKTSICSHGWKILLTRREGKPQLCRSDIAICLNTSPGYLFLLNGSEFGKIYACEWRYKFISFLYSEWRKLILILKIDATTIPFSFFVDHGYLQNAGAEFLGHSNLRYFVYLFPNDISVYNSITYRYNWDLQVAGPRKENRACETTLAVPKEEAVLNVSIVQKQNYSKSKNYIK